jgi:nucleoid-associated protein YgaU
MNLKFSLSALRRRTLLLIVVVALSVAMLPTAAFASGGNYGRQGRAYDPGPRQHNQKQYHKNQHNQKHNNKQYNRCDVTYRVKKGDSLSEIAQWYGVSVHQLAKANGIKNPNRIYKGQVICIPC